MRLCFILGTRPEIIKTAPIAIAAREAGLTSLMIHTGQHYDESMDGRFFEELSLPAPDIRLAAGNRPYAEQVAYLLRELPEALNRLAPDALVLQGDTVSVLAGALSAQRLNIPIIHHEAGLRSRDPRMSEEYHRIITDHISSVLCAPSEDAARHLMEEGVPRERVYLTGNTVVDAVRLFASEAERRSRILQELALVPRSYFVLTFHRAENVDERGRFQLFLESIGRVAAEHPDRQIVFTVHPRVEKRCLEFGAEWPRGVRPIAPLGYLDMLRLLSSADLVMTDSGGLQEESAIIGVPCVTLRDSTERPETVDAGVNIVAGLEPENVSQAVAAMRGRFADPIAAYGDGQAAQRIIRIIMSTFARRSETAHETAAV